MDRKDIEAIFRYEQMKEQHVSGGYFSEAVRAQADDVVGFSEGERLEFFADAFNLVFATSKLVESHPRFNTERNQIDLGEEHLGIINLETYEYSAEEAAEDGEPDSASRGIFVQTSFDPTQESDENPQFWGESSYAGLDGSYRADSRTDFKYELMRVLDAKETLDIVCEALNIQDPTEQ